jgi:hypothetical protein
MFVIIRVMIVKAVIGQIYQEQLQIYSTLLPYSPTPTPTHSPTPTPSCLQYPIANLCYFLILT